MAVLRLSLMRLLLGASLVLTPAAVLAQAPAPSPSAPSAPATNAPQAVPATQVEAAPSSAHGETPWEDPTAAKPAEDSESLGWTLVRTLLVLGAVIAAIYLTLNVGLRRLMGLQGVAGRTSVVSVVERVALDPRRTLFVLKAGDEYLLVGGGESGLQMLSKLDTEAVERIRASRPAATPLPMSPFLQKLLARRSGGSQSQPPGA